MSNDRVHLVAEVDVPLGARLLGCRNCRVGDRTRHPELGLVWCASCPVTLRRMARGKTFDQATGDNRERKAA